MNPTRLSRDILQLDRRFCKICGRKDDERLNRKGSCTHEVHKLNPILAVVRHRTSVILYSTSSAFLPCSSDEFQGPTVTILALGTQTYGYNEFSDKLPLSTIPTCQVLGSYELSRYIDRAPSWGPDTLRCRERSNIRLSSIVRQRV